MRLSFPTPTFGMKWACAIQKVSYDSPVLHEEREIDQKQRSDADTPSLLSHSQTEELQGMKHRWGVPVHLVEHEIVGPTKNDRAGRLDLGVLEENQLPITDALLRNL